MIIKFNFETLRDCPLRDIIFSSEYTFAVLYGQLYSVRNNYIKAVYFLWKLNMIREIQLCVKFRQGGLLLDTLDCQFDYICN